MKREKLNLENLSVKSFVTVLDAEKSNLVVGGAATDVCQTGDYVVADPAGVVVITQHCDIQIG